MAAEQPETDAFLAFIERKIAALQQLADSYRAAMAIGALGNPILDDGGGFPSSAAWAQGSYVPYAANTSMGASDLPTGIFLNKSMPAAIKLLMQTTKKKYTPKDVAKALKDGGFESTSAIFDKVVMNTMYRMKSEGELLKFKDGWGLAELYPESLRMRITKDAKVKPAKGGKKVRRSPQRKGSAVTKEPEKASAAGPVAVPAA